MGDEPTRIERARRASRSRATSRPPTEPAGRSGSAVRRASKEAHPPAPLGVVDYTLAKRALLRSFRGGLLSKLEICDAHPELLRAATYLGTEAARPCPVCRRRSLRLLAYVFASSLRANNGRAWDVDEGRALAAHHRDASCYVVEVCTACSWNHLAEASMGRSAG